MPTAHHAWTEPAWDRTGALARIQDEALFRLVCETFHGDAPRLVARVREALDAGRPGDAVVSAHALKAAAANVGAEQCRALAADMERLARSGDGALVRGLLPLFDEAFRRFQDALAAAGWSVAGTGRPA
jgi:HPt (histidine-containing phosphotransfer) domain-containing protein